MGSIANFFDELANIALDDDGNDDDDQTIFAAMLDFFTEDDWSFLRIQGEPAPILFG